MEANFGDFRIEFLGEFEPICKTSLAHESGPGGGGLIDDWVENLDTLSL
jgi:hypothetical protein